MDLNMIKRMLKMMMILYMKSCLAGVRTREEEMF